MELGYVLSSEEHRPLENARVYTLPDEPIEVVVAAGGPGTADLAARAGDGLVSTAPDTEVIAPGRPDQAGFMEFYEREILEEAMRLGPMTDRVAA